MSYDLVQQFKELSVSTQKPVPLNKVPFSVRTETSEFSSFDSTKLSTRIMLNYKDMSSMGLKAGFLVRLSSDGTFIFTLYWVYSNFYLDNLIANVFEVWPSVVMKVSGIKSTFA